MIYIIITACINNKHCLKNDTHRQNLYIENTKQLLKFVEKDEMIKTIIVENNGSRHTYLNDLNCDVFYTDNNMLSFGNKGGNELADLKDVIDHYNIQNEDTIIKVTGRYKFLNSNFINLVKNNIHYDAFIKFFNVCTHEYMFDDCVLGLFSIKCKFLKEFNYKFQKSPEKEFADYSRENINPNKLFEVKNLDLECCFADDLRTLIV